jgi:signal transduction histidine kinase
MDMNELTIADAATQALAEIKLKKELIALESEIGKDPATEESIRQLAQHIRDSQAELAAIPQELRRDKNYKIAEHCHDMLKEECDAHLC